MRRRNLFAALTVTAALIAACSDNPVPTAPNVTGDPALLGSITTDGCVDQTLMLFPNVDNEVKFLITNLYSGSHESSALTMWENLKKDKLDGQPLQNHVDNLAKWTLEKLSAGEIMDPDGEGLLNATTGSIRVLDLVFRCVGETPTQLPEPPEGFDAAFEIVEPSSDPQQFNTSFNDAGSFLPGGALNAKTMLVLVRQDVEVQVNTPFPKLSHTVDVALAGGRLNEGRRISVLFCPIQIITSEIEARAVVAHQRMAAEPGAPTGEGVEYLDPEEGGQISCPDDQASAWRHEKGFLRQRAMQVASLARKAIRFVSPRLAYAGHAAIGGSLDDEFFSPMVVVDPFVETEIVLSAITQPITFGENVPVTARLRIKDVPANPAVYRGTWVNPDAVTGVVNQTQTRNTNLPMAARIDEGSRTPAVTDNASFANWSFACIAAGNHTATVDFAQTQVVANAPLYGPSTATSESFVVNQRDLTVTANDKSREYGEPNPTLDGSLVGVQTQCDAPEKFTQVYATEANAMSDVPGPYPITADVAFNTADGDVNPANYNLIKVNAGLTITPAPLAINANSYERLYGDPNPGFEGTIVGIKNSDAITLTFATTADVMSQVGDYPIVPTAVGDRLFNYVIASTTNGNLRINPAPLTLTIDSKTRMYGDPNPEFTYSLEVIRNGDALTVNPTTEAGTLSPVGEYLIDGTVMGARAQNYDVTKNTGTLTVTQRPLTVVADNQSREYGAANPTLTGVVTNSVAGDGLEVSYSTTADATSDVGNYAITPAIGGAAASNYAPVTLTDGVLTVTRAPLSLFADNYTRAFGQDNPSFSGTILGIKNDDVISLTFSTTATASSAAGNYPIVPAAVGDRLFNYFINSVTNGTLSIVAASFGGNGLLGSSSGTSRTGTIRPNPGSLFGIDMTTGLATVVGATGVNNPAGHPGVSDIAVDPTTGQLYGITGAACDGAILIRIDRTTGAGTVVGTLIGSGFNGTGGTFNGSCNGGSDGLAFSSDGTLYAGGWGGGFGSGSFLRVDKNTGAVLERFGTTGGIHLAGLSFAPNGQLWASRGGNGPGVIHVINPANGQTMSTLALSDGAVVSDLAFDSDGTLWAALPQENQLARIDTTTGVITRVGSFGSSTTRMSGLTFAP